MSDHVYDIADWLVHNIEDLSIQFMDAETSLPIEAYLANRAVMAFQNRLTPIEVRAAFDDHRIQVIVSFYCEGRDESEDSVH